MLNGIGNALKQLKENDRLIGLIVIAVMISLTMIVTQYFKGDSCKGIMDENIKMHKDFQIISQMLREERMKGLQSNTDSMSVDNGIQIGVLDKINSIVEGNIKP